MGYGAVLQFVRHGTALLHAGVGGQNLTERRQVIIQELSCIGHRFRLLLQCRQNFIPDIREWVYIKLEEKEEEYEISFKNVSAAEMNFDAKEITERFVRGDLARNTEGSGLGLAIASSFTELQGGRFEVEIDGDLFKAKVSVSKLKCENILAKQGDNE